MEHSLMAIYAHPDDEAFGTGGTISRYASEGVKVYLVSATRGEVGEISDPSLATPETLGCVREDELRCAAETMGVTQLVFLDYRDSGMAGTPENQDPRAFVNAQAEEVVPLLVSLIRSLRPEVIVTFEPNGGYGHPDHIAIHKHTVAAFRAAADPTCSPELGTTWQAKRLFYTAIPHSFFEDMRQQMTDLGLDTQDLVNLDDPSLRWPDEAINVHLDVSHSVELKWQALQCHRTQFGPGNLFRRLPEERVKKLMSKEYFALAWPEPGPGLQLPDLFAGV
jgi:N-acetyl-1-D-myo-inositol-2-amino-2-deoxy-alpha-D-glucopyranoside deacetylase